MLMLKDKANAYFGQLVKMCDGASSERAELVHARAVLAVVAKRELVYLRP